jgi:ssDNA-specific exonuclease RecJ
MVKLHGQLAKISKVFVGLGLVRKEHGKIDVCRETKMKRYLASQG